MTGADPAANGQASGRKQRPKAEVRLYEVSGSLPPTETRNWRVMRNNLAALLDAADAVQRVRALHVADERPYELIWYGDEPCPTCHADGITTECDGHDTICCSACWQPHPEDSSIAGPVPYPCPTIRALEGPNR